MTIKEKFREKQIFTCKACGFGYLQKDTAQKCEAYCKKYHSCSLEITRKAVKTE